MTNDEEVETVGADEETQVATPLFIPHQRLVQNEDETWDEFVARRRMVNMVMRLIARQKNGYRPATRLVAGGLRNRMSDFHPNQAAEADVAAVAQRRAKNKIARRSRRINRAA